MQLSKSAIKEYQIIFKEVFEEDISYADAEKQGQDLLTLFSLLLKK